MSIINRFRQPEYTGENRCMPCTGVNIVIASVAGALAAVVSTLAGVGIFSLAVVTIYLRGYLVPNTSTLTKRYFPERVLRWFDKNATALETDAAIEINPEQVLLDANAVEPRREGIDPCLTADFQQVWHERIHTVRAHILDENHLASALDVLTTDDRITVDQQDDAFVAYTDDTVIVQWRSQAAVIADVAAATELSGCVPNWSDFTPAEIARVLMSLRTFIEQCPNCDAPVQVEQEVVESCCRSYDVIASVCQDCDTRLFGMEWDSRSGTVSDTQNEQPEPVQYNSN